MKPSHFRIDSQFSIIIFVTTTICLLMINDAFSQVIKSEQKSEEAIPEKIYDNIVSLSNSELTNGPEYFISFGGGTTNPFFGSLQLEPSEIWFDGQHYSDVYLMYDAFTDKVILRKRNKSGLLVMVELDQTKIERFTLYKHQFVKITPPSSLKKWKQGFYDVLYEGTHVLLLSKRVKVENITTSNVEYKSDDLYYVVEAGKWTAISTAKSLFKLAKAKQGADAFFLANTLKNKFDEEDMKIMASFLETLPGMNINNSK